MDGLVNLLNWFNWSPGGGSSDGTTDVSMLVIVVMAFIGATIITRIVRINTSFNFSVNFVVMLAGCLLVHSWTNETLLPISNDLVASAVSANFGMTLAGFALLFGYRNSF